MGSSLDLMHRQRSRASRLFDDENSPNENLMFVPTMRCNHYSKAYGGHVDKPLAEIGDNRWSTGTEDCDNGPLRSASVYRDCGGHMIFCLGGTSVFACTLSDSHLRHLSALRGFL